MIPAVLSNGNNKITSLYQGELQRCYTLILKMELIGLDQINSAEETFLFNTNLELTQVENDIEKLKLLIEKDEEILKLKTKIKNSYESKYKNGVATMSDLLIRINDENAAGQDKILHEIQHLMKAYKYMNLTGN